MLAIPGVLDGSGVVLVGQRMEERDAEAVTLGIASRLLGFS